MSELLNKPKKTCKFNDNIIIYETYAPDEYDRHCIDSILYQKVYNRVSESEWQTLLDDLNTYKNNEMVIHISNLNNVYYVFK
jgi:predicted GNAT family acetyltransferase